MLESGSRNLEGQLIPSNPDVFDLSEQPIISSPSNPNPATKPKRHTEIVSLQTISGESDDEEPDVSLSNLTQGKTPNPKKVRVIFDTWILGKKIGTGSSGSVKLVMHKEIGKKPLMARNVDGIALREHFMIREALVGVTLDHPNIIKMHSYLIGKNHFYFFYEFLDGMDLADFISDRGRMSEIDARKVFKQILSAVEYTHKNNVIHRDLKLENIRIDPISMHIHLLDFGFSTFYSPKFKQHSSCGSPCYASPEIYLHKPYRGPEVDVWSLGICLYGVTVQTLPFEKECYDDMSEIVCKGEFHMPEHLSAELQSLILSMLAVDPIHRISLVDVIHSPWMQANPSSVLWEEPSKKLKQQQLGPIVVAMLAGSRPLPPQKLQKFFLRELERRSSWRKWSLERQWREEGCVPPQFEEGDVVVSVGKKPESVLTRKKNLLQVLTRMTEGLGKGKTEENLESIATPTPVRSKRLIDRVFRKPRQSMGGPTVGMDPKVKTGPSWVQHLLPLSFMSRSNFRGDSEEAKKPHVEESPGVDDSIVKRMLRHWSTVPAFVDEANAETRRVPGQPVSGTSNSTLFDSSTSAEETQTHDERPNHILLEKPYASNLLMPTGIMGWWKKRFEFEGVMKERRSEVKRQSEVVVEDDSLSETESFECIEPLAQQKSLFQRWTEKIAL
ncbi:serine/threonine-protein kinase KIN2 [Podochytrium sp. JEL0797]|nr:serine/threonine-protein kinase KIN2 [Podochytrium sp. JEL0797]